MFCYHRLSKYFCYYKYYEIHFLIIVAFKIKTFEKYHREGGLIKTVDLESLVVDTLVLKQNRIMPSVLDDAIWFLHGLCIKCNSGVIETIQHLILECPQYECARNTRFQTITSKDDQYESEQNNTRAKTIPVIN